MDRNGGAGITIMLIAAVLFGLSDISIKVLGGDLSPWQITAGRGLLGLVGVLAAIRFKISGLLVRQWPVQLGVGLAGALGFTGFIIAIKYLPLSMALPLGYVYPALGALLSPLINREKPNKSDWTAIALALLAVVFLSRGSGAQAGPNGTIGLIAGLVGAFFVALMINLARRQTKSVTLSVNLFYLFLGNFLLGLAFTVVLDNHLCPSVEDSARMFFVIAPSSVVGFALMLKAYKTLTAFRGATLLMLEAMVVSLYGVIGLGEPLTPNLIFGGFLMLLSAVIIAGGNAEQTARPSVRPRLP